MSHEIFTKAVQIFLVTDSQLSFGRYQRKYKWSEASAKICNIVRRLKAFTVGGEFQTL